MFVMGCTCNDCNGACVCPSSQRRQHWLSPRARERDIRTKLNKMNALFIAVAMNMMNGTWAPDGARGGVASKVHIIVGLKWLKYQKHRGILSSCTGEPLSICSCHDRAWNAATDSKPVATFWVKRISTDLATIPIGRLPPIRSWQL